MIGTNASYERGCATLSPICCYRNHFAAQSCSRRPACSRFSPPPFRHLPSHSPLSSILASARASGDISPMAWFRKEKKPRQPRGERLEIPADVWEKCEACGHTDIREKFAKNKNVCPSCDYHRRIRAIDYVNILLDEGSIDETEQDLRSTDPLGFPEYQERLK